MPGGTFCQRDQDIMSFSLIKNKIRNNKKVLKPHRKADVSFQKNFTNLPSALLRSSLECISYWNILLNLSCINIDYHKVTSSIFTA